MADGSKIEWTDSTWQPITGCSVISPGCTNCYAMKLAGGRLRNHPSRKGLTKPTKAGPVWTGEVRLNEGWLNQPKRWTRPRKIFVCAHGDIAHEQVTPFMFAAVATAMDDGPQHEYQILTKRPLRLLYLLDKIGRQPSPNWLIGVSVEDQARAAERRQPIAAIANLGWRTFVSYEPAIGAVDWTGWEFLAWMISGGESGVGARPTHPDWHRATRDWCATHGIPYLFKQFGAWAPWGFEGQEKGPSRSWRAWNGTAWGEYQGGDVADTVALVGKKAAGRLLDGVEHNGFPTSLAA